MMMSQNKVDWLTQRKLSCKFNFFKVSKKKICVRFRWLTWVTSEISAEISIEKAYFFYLCRRVLRLNWVTSEISSEAAQFFLVVRAFGG